MTWEEVEDTASYNVAGIVTLVSAIILNLLNGTLLHMSSDFKLPEMNTNDILTIVLSIIAGVYTLLKIYHEILKIIERRRDMREKAIIQAAIEERTHRAREKFQQSNDEAAGIKTEDLGDS